MIGRKMVALVHHRFEMVERRERQMKRDARGTLRHVIRSAIAETGLRGTYAAILLSRMCADKGIPIFTPVPKTGWRAKAKAEAAKKKLMVAA